MPRNQRDRSRIALGQKHEVYYIKKRAEKLIELTENDLDIQGPRSQTSFSTKKGIVDFPTKTIQRICKALLKLLK